MKIKELWFKELEIGDEFIFPLKQDVGTFSLQTKISDSSAKDSKTGGVIEAGPQDLIEKVLER